MNAILADNSLSSANRLSLGSKMCASQSVSLIEMSDAPPPKFVAYPRPDLASGYGTVDKLQALGEGYFGLSNVFALNVLIAVLVGCSGVTNSLEILALGIVMMFAAIFFISLPYTKKVAFGKGWPEWKAKMAAILIGLNAVLCCGIVGYSVLQSIAMAEMKKYGVQPGYFGLSKKQFMAFVNKRRESERFPSMSVGPPV
jgi:hypothetical protein